MTNITAHTYPAVAAKVTGNYDLVGWGSYATLGDQVIRRTFGYLVAAAVPFVKEYHSDLYLDAGWIEREFNHAFGTESKTSHNFMVCVRHSGTNIGSSARLMFETLAYDAALYLFEVNVDGRGQWHLSIDLLDARPSRPDSGV